MRAAGIGTSSRPVSARPTVNPLARASTPAVALTGIVCLAAGLRLASLSPVPNNLFYDAAVRSMARSWHNFFYAAFEPGGLVAIDKPPIDLWLQVASVKLLGFNSLALKLPEAIAGTLSVPLIYVTARRLFGTLVGLVSALALAVLPITVLTARSDTMDTVMVTLVLVAAWLVVRAAETGRARFLYLAAVVMGIDFNVKLFEALVPLPAFLALYLLAVGKPAGWMLRQAGVAAVLFVTVALSWPVAVSVSPASNKPYPLGSANGSVWSSIFVFNGVDRVGRSPRAGHLRETHDDVPAPSATRLFTGNRLDRRVGSELLPAIVLGAAALALTGSAAFGRVRRRGYRLDRLAFAGAVALALWLAVGTVGFSTMARLHPRYLEALSPAIAATLGVAVVGIARASIEQRCRRLVLFPAVVVFGLCIAYAMHLAGNQAGLRAFILCTAALASICLLVPAIEPPLRMGDAGRRRQIAVITALLLLPLLAVPASESLAVVRHHASDSTTALSRAPRRLARLRNYLIAHQGKARYEVATRNPWQAAPLIVRDRRPLLIVRNVNGHVLVSVRVLRAKVRSGQLRYVWLGRRCSEAQARHFRSCQPLARWVRRHGTPVSHLGRQTGLWRVRAHRAK